MKIVHAADLHLDSPLVGLDRYEGVPVHRIRNATRRAFENLIELCIDEQVELLVLAGDLWDGEWRDYSTGLFFAAGMTKLRQVGTEVVWIRGNHDAQSRIRRHVKFPENVRELSPRKVESVLYEKLGVAIHGQGFANREVTENLALAYPSPKPSLFNIGLLHTSVTGRVGHAPYAPCTLDDLVTKAYDYWALGHVHRREVLASEPWVVFPGNLQGRHAKERGEKGATLITVENLRATSVEHRALDVVRFVHCSVDASEAASSDDVLEAIETRLRDELARAEGRLVAARVGVEGASAAHAALMRNSEGFSGEVHALANDLGTEDLWIEQVRVETRAPIDLAALAKRDDALGEVLRCFESLKLDEAALLELGNELSEAIKKLPAAVREGPDALALEDPSALRVLLDDAERELLPRLVDSGETA